MFIFAGVSYTLIRTKLIAERVSKIVEAKTGGRLHHHSKYICKRCNRHVDRIEAYETLRSSFVALFWKTRNQPIPSQPCIEDLDCMTSKNNDYQPVPSQHIEDPDSTPSKNNGHSKQLFETPSGPSSMSGLAEQNDASNLSEVHDPSAVLQTPLDIGETDAVESFDIEEQAQLEVS